MEAGSFEEKRDFGQTDQAVEELHCILKEMLNENLQHIILSNTRNPKQASKVKIRPILMKDKLFFQETLYQGAQVFHANFTSDQMLSRIEAYLTELFKQGEMKGDFLEATVLVSKKGRLTVKTKRRNAQPLNVQRRDLSHNREKQYILKEGAPVDFLVGLGVQTPDGKVAKAKYDKFRQINRYLEFIEDVLEELPKDRCIRIIDFGCGKSYLTFAMYYYLHELQKREITVTGLDLKTDVIANCNALARELHYDGLHFERGDISTYEGCEQVDMVVTLHACDTATDFALEKAVKWGAGVIMAVPCCQHEINKQIQCDALLPVLRYGIIKERMSALITDALRADILEQCGYSTQILEFIDMEHTPKNLLIRAVKNNGCQASRDSLMLNKKIRTRKNTMDGEDLRKVEEFLHITPTLQHLLLK